MNSSRNHDTFPPEILRGLEQAGLKPKEARVYLALLRLGETGTSSIAHETGLHGQFVYGALDALEERGLAQRALIRGRRKYRARNPRHLSDQLAERKRSLDAVIHDIENRITVDPEHQFEIFQGRESFVANERALLEVMPKGGHVLVIGGEHDSYTRACGSAIAELDALRVRKHIEVRYVGAQSQAKELRETAEIRLLSFRLLPGVFEGSSNYAIYEELGVFGLYVFAEPVTSFMVRNQMIASNFKTFFEILWKMGR